MNDRMLSLNPLSVLEKEFVSPLSEGGIMVVESNAGVGKTAFLVQLALGAMFAGKDVLHVNIGEPIEKVDLWYKQMFNNSLTSGASLSLNEVWDSLLPHRFIMTFKIDGFSLPRLLERTKDLSVQRIFEPEVMVVDGLDLADLAKMETDFSKIKDIGRKGHPQIWFSVTIDGEAGINVIPYDVVIRLQQEGDGVAIVPRKGFKSNMSLKLNPVTMIME
ncbi:MAG: hypothetical protein K9K75_03855 [Deltaproteobacteria bacterium]|nr:hypothetical protein [Deltaproteobacteria bacterium]